MAVEAATATVKRILESIFDGDDRRVREAMQSGYRKTSVFEK